MPPYNPRARYPQGNVRLSIPSLSGGVGRQAPTKRAQNEAENIDNALVSLERSVEKRAPMQFVRRYTDATFDTLDSDDLSAFDFGTDVDDANLFMHWFSVSDDQRYLCVIDYSSANPATYFSLYRTTKEGFYKCNIDASAMHDYLTYGYSDGLPMNLKAITIGPQLVVLNSNVYMGYSSVYDPDTDGGIWRKIGKDGNFATGEDLDGRKIIYYTTTKVDPEGQATIYVESKFYVKNDQVFALVPDGTDLSDYLSKSYDFSQIQEIADFTKTTGSPDDLYYFFGVTTGDMEEDLTNEWGIVDWDLKYGPNEPSPTTSEMRLGFESSAKRTEFVDIMTKFYVTDRRVFISDATNVTDAGIFYLVWSGAGNPDVEAVLSDLGEYLDSQANISTPLDVTFRFKGIDDDYLTLPTELSGMVDGNNVTNTGSSIAMIFKCVQDGVAEGDIPQDPRTAKSDAAAFVLRSGDEGSPLAEYVAVEDWDYPEAGRAYLGAALEDFSEFQFPPNANDVDDNNSGAGTIPYVGEARETLEALYPDSLGVGDGGRTTAGTGRVYFVENSYAGEPPGYYIVQQTDDRPYVKLIRSPYEYSVLDRDRFPKIVKITTPVDIPGGDLVEQFTIQNFELEHRTSGNLTTNPGPAAWKDGLQAPIKSIAFFRDRLFLSVGDNVFSSRTGDFSDFWVQDPSTVQETDPIDVRLSTNKFAPVATMTPFQQYLFINTESDIQFTLQGSENKITPLNAEVSPTAFYSTAPLVDPLLLGSQIYFFAPRRTYIYFNDATVSVNQAVETSLNCPDYLPTNFGKCSVVPGYDSIIMLDKDNPKYMYVYTNRYSGGKVSQNAFFRYIFRTDIEFVESFDNDMYFVTKNPTGESTARWNMGFMPFREEDYYVPLLDQWVYVGGADDEGSVVYDSNADVTTFTVPKYFNLSPEYIYVVPQEADEASGELYAIDPANVTLVNGTLTVTFEGDKTEPGRRYVVGSVYTMSVELSPQYMRDDNQNMIEGIVSLRTMSTQHFNTGTYRVEKSINGRRSTTMTFTPSQLDDEQYTSAFDVPLPLYESRGETFSKIMGFSSDTQIYIVSDYPNPCNITQIELKGRFTGKSSGFVR